jgi:L-ascorbate metabolism protein UlaG (beta-lactamase superfamily)
MQRKRCCFVNLEKGIIIHYIYHSGFTVEYGDYFLVFDYFKQKKSNGEKLDIGHEISMHKKPLVFVSHGHSDHYNPEIFEWKSRNPNLQYIISNDVKRKNSENGCIFMGPYETMEKSGITIATYGSTDIGVSYFLDIDGLRIFHAGDLNWWHWAEESTEEELKEEEEKFKSEVSRFDGKRIDILFFPVDPRLGDHYWLGGGYMVEKFKPGLFVPMHFADNAEITSRFAEKMAHTGVSIAEISHPGQIIELRY